MTYDQSNDEWQWRTDKTKVDVDSEFWAQDEPGNQAVELYCAAIHRSGWRDVSCITESRPFVCQFIPDVQAEPGDAMIDSDLNKCLGDRVQCPNGKLCMKSGSFCDGINDCGDSSDEQNCENYEVKCLYGQKSCSAGTESGQCYYVFGRCDGHKDCDNGFDELGCDYINIRK